LRFAEVTRHAGERSVRLRDPAAQHVDDEEVIGQHRAEQLMIGGKQGGEERFIAGENPTGADVVCRLHCSIS